VDLFESVSLDGRKSNDVCLCASFSLQNAIIKSHFLIVRNLIKLCLPKMLVHTFCCYKHQNQHQEVGCVHQERMRQCEDEAAEIRQLKSEIRQLRSERQQQAAMHELQLNEEKERAREHLTCALEKYERQHNKEMRAIEDKDNKLREAEREWERARDEMEQDNEIERNKIQLKADKEGSKLKKQLKEKEDEIQDKVITPMHACVHACDG
jgi:hypothetical protein